MDIQAERSRTLLDNDNSSLKYKNVEATEADSQGLFVKWRDIRPQIIVANLGFFFTLHSGVNLVFSNLILNDFDIHVSSWFASIVGFSTPLGACLGGILMDKIGRKKSNILVTVPCLLSYLLTFRVSSDQVMVLYLARFLAGIAGGMSTANMVYVSEISHRQYRPVFLSLLTVYTSLGVLLTTVLKLVFSWKQTALFYSGLFSLAALLLILYTPESPVWLNNIRHDRTKARKSLRLLYSNYEVFQAEWRVLTSTDAAKKSFKEKRNVKFTSPIVYKPFYLLCLLLFLQQLSGFYVCVFYVIKIFPALSTNKGETFKDEAFLVAGIIRFMTSVLVSLISARIARKSLLLTSSLGMLFSCALAVCSVNEVFGWYNEELAITSFLLYIGMGSIGVMNIPWTLSAELLPTEVRGMGSTILVSYGYFLISILTKVFPFLMEGMGVGFMFGFFGVVCGVLALVTYAMIPETLGKSFEQIEEYFEK